MSTKQTPNPINLNNNKEVLDAVHKLIASRKEKADRIISLFDNLDKEKQVKLRRFVEEDVHEIIKSTYRQSLDFLTKDEQLVIAGYLYSIE